jgi:aminoglycoside phosphotransferase (APT) family kinase protein
VVTAGEARADAPDDTRLRLTLERLWQEARGCRIKAAGLRRRASPFATLFPAEVVTLVLETGEEVSFFVKHLGPEQADHPEKQCRDREPRVYAELLGGEGLPVPRYYGSRWNEATKRREVFLEYIDDWDLRYQGLEHWFTAARRLARLHAHFASRAGRLFACDFLLRLDAGQLGRWAGPALEVVAGQSAGLAAELARVADAYGRACHLLGEQPVTLVHNDVAPKNVLADRAHRPARICFVDWEMAGVGCGLLDLVDLKYGLDPVNDQKMRAAYCDELAGAGLLPATGPELDRLFAACELHRTVYRLAFSKAWRLPPERVARWVAEARDLADQV